MSKRIYLLLVSVLSLFATSWLELYFFRRQNLIGGGINRTFLFLLINAHLIISILLLYFIIRHSIKLVIERRKEVPGSAFRRNLFFAFIIFSVIPVVFVFVVAGKLLSVSVDNWFQARIGVGLENSLVLHQQQTQKLRRAIVCAGNQLVKRLHRTRTVEKVLHHMRADRICRWYIWKKNGGPVVGSIHDEVHVWRSYRKVNDRSTHTLRRLFLQELAQTAYAGKVFDFYGSLYFVRPLLVPPCEQVFLVGVMRYPESIRYPLIEVQNSVHDYEQLKTMYHPIYWNYVWTFILLTLLVLFLSIWCAFYLAGGISKPIQDLMQAFENMRKGDLGVRLAYMPADDLRYLAIGFNEMSQSLQQAYAHLEFHNQEMMTMLEHIKESVFFVNNWGRILTYNAAACRLVERYLALAEFKDKKIYHFGSAIKREYFVLVKLLRQSNKTHLSKEISFLYEGELKIFMVYIAAVQNALFKKNNGVLIVVDDVSDVYKMNKIKTWQEAAKQMAHEIKNPLTPIQLATQRMHRRLKAQEIADTTMVECVETILHQVAIIKDLVSHFSEFAKMPDSVVEPLDVNLLIKEVVALYEMSYPEIAFIYDLEAYLPAFKADRNKVKRLMINLLDNSTRILQKMRTPPYVEYGGAFMPKKIITIKTHFKKGGNQIEILVADNGPGIAKEVQEKLFLPYVSTSNKNMGLGLAIVRDIVSQAGGAINLVPTSQGATFQILFPI